MTPLTTAWNEHRAKNSANHNQVLEDMTGLRTTRLRWGGTGSGLCEDEPHPLSVTPPGPGSGMEGSSFLELPLSASYLTHLRQCSHLYQFTLWQLCDCAASPSLNFLTVE